MKGMNFMKQAKEMMAKVEKMKADISQMTAEATVGGGMVTVVARGDHKIVSIKIDPEVIDADDVEMLQDLVLSAINEALRKIQDHTQAEMSKLTGGLNIPGLM